MASVLVTSRTADARVFQPSGHTIGMMLTSTSWTPLLRDWAERKDSVAAAGWHCTRLSNEMPYRGSYATRFVPAVPSSWKSVEQAGGGVKVVVRGRNEVTVPPTVCGGKVVGSIVAHGRRWPRP